MFISISVSECVGLSEIVLFNLSLLFYVYLSYLLKNIVYFISNLKQYMFSGGVKFLYWMLFPDTRQLMLVRLKI